jgi:hypothetical protein
MILEVNIIAALRKIDKFQQPNGGLTTAELRRDKRLGTTYAGHFMLRGLKKLA